MGRFFKDITSAPDRGKSFYQQERQRQHLASLVEAGRCAVTAKQWSIDSDSLPGTRLPADCCCSAQSPSGLQGTCNPKPQRGVAVQACWADACRVCWSQHQVSPAHKGCADQKIKNNAL